MGRILKDFLKSVKDFCSGCNVYLLVKFNLKQIFRQNLFEQKDPELAWQIHEPSQILNIFNFSTRTTASF